MMKKNSERNAAIRFMKKLFILFIPFIALLAVYFLDDPFMVLKNYERYDQTPVVLNEGHVGWQMYLNNRDTIPIDSYIMETPALWLINAMNGKNTSTVEEPYGYSEMPKALPPSA